MKTVALSLVLAAAYPASASNIYLLSSSDTTIDNAAALALTSRGHTVTIGVQYLDFDGTISLAGFQAVYFQDNFDWQRGPMPAAGQQQLVNFVTAGGHLVTTEWIDYLSTSNFPVLAAILPFQATTTYGSVATATYQVLTPSPALNAGLPSSFSFPLDSFSGTECFAPARPGATAFYSTSNSATAPALAGWAQGAGYVFSFTSTCGPDQVADTNFGRLLSNAMTATAAPPCEPNCDGSSSPPILNVADFTCFLQKFAGGAAYANCDGSTTAPILNVADFTCFLQKFAAGCP